MQNFQHLGLFSSSFILSMYIPGPFQFQNKLLRRRITISATSIFHYSRVHRMFLSSLSKSIKPFFNPLISVVILTFNLSSNHSGSPLAAESNPHGIGGVTSLVRRRTSFSPFRLAEVFVSEARLVSLSMFFLYPSHRLFFLSSQSWSGS